MADDKMRNDDLNQYASDKGDEGNIGQKTPSRNPQDDQSTGRRSGANEPNEGGGGQGQSGRQGQSDKGDMGQRR